MNTVIDLIQGSDLEILIQDDLTGLIRLEVVAEGRVIPVGETN